jgi:hypothetical protein
VAVVPVLDAVCVRVSGGSRESAPLPQGVRCGARDATAVHGARGLGCHGRAQSVPHIPPSPIVLDFHLSHWACLPLCGLSICMRAGVARSLEAKSREGTVAATVSGAAVPHGRTRSVSGSLPTLPPSGRVGSRRVGPICSGWMETAVGVDAGMASARTRR